MPIASMMPTPECGHPRSFGANCGQRGFEAASTRCWRAPAVAQGFTGLGGVWSLTYYFGTIARWEARGPRALMLRSSSAASPHDGAPASAAV
jgi:hypothetical protein